jgi:hypothetical protein
MNQISPLNPFPDAEVERSASPEALAELARAITSASARPRTTARRPRRRGSRRRTLLTAVLAVASAAAALLIAGTFGSPGTAVGPLPIGPSTAQALTFTTSGGYIIVTVRDPLADAARYRAEFAAHHLRITLKLVPASPSIVGTLVYADGGDAITPITAVGRCFTGGGGANCPVGVRIPLAFKGTADLVFGRAARPGEQYESAGLATAPGEALHGLTFRGRTVAWVRARLRDREVTVTQYRTTSSTPAPEPVPLDWHVYDAIPWAPGQILLVVGPTTTDALPPPPARYCGSSSSYANQPAPGPGPATPIVCRPRVH